MNQNHAMYLETINFADESNSQRLASHIVGDLTEDEEKSSIASDGDLNDASEGSHQLVAYMAKRARSMTDADDGKDSSEEDSDTEQPSQPVPMTERRNLNIMSS